MTVRQRRQYHWERRAREEEADTYLYIKYRLSAIQLQLCPPGWMPSSAVNSGAGEHLFEAEVPIRDNAQYIDCNEHK